MTRGFRILHAEDDPGDAQLVRLALREGTVPCEVHHVSDGEQALSFLRDRDAPRPDLVLLDLNMPRVGGHEALARIKADPVLRTIPVIVLSTSDAPHDVERSYEAHVNSYMRKPMGFDQLVDLMQRLESFWAEAAVLPN